jgi:hypothetical protein
VGTHWDTPLNVNLDINGKGQDYKTGAVCAGGVQGGGGRVKEGDWDDGVWLMDFIYLYETELENLLELL